MGDLEKGRWNQIKRTLGKEQVSGNEMHFEDRLLNKVEFEPRIRWAREPLSQLEVEAEEAHEQ
jgi:hypothetical protein